ncbi:MAG: amino acid adenylation domain-containing protein [Fuerstiella sp.]
MTVTTPIELAANQQMIWLGQQNHPTAPLYEMCHTFDVSGAISPTDFRAAFVSLVQSTPVLRTVASDADWTFATTAAEVNQPCDFEDVSRSHNAEEAADILTTKRLKNHFQPTIALYDSLLIKLSTTRYRWVMRLHHLLTDGTNSRQLLAAMSEHYGAQRQQKAAPNRTNYADAVTANLKFCNNHLEKQHANWWAERSEPQPSYGFYGDSRSEEKLNHHRHRLVLTDEENKSIQSLCETPPFRQFSSGLSRSNVLTTALTALLSRIHQTQSVRIGMTSHGRTTTASRESIGLMMQLLPFQVQVLPNDSFVELSRKVALETRSFLQHCVPGSMNVQTAKACDVVLNILDLSVDNFAGLPTKSSWWHHGYGDPAQKLAISAILNSDGQHQLLFDFNSSVFTEARQLQFVSHFRNMLAVMKDNQHSVIHRACFLTDKERQFGQATKGSSDLPQKVNLWDRFLTTAQQHLHQAAVTTEDHCYTYSELKLRAENIAAQLRNVHAGSVIPVLCRRGAWAVESILGVLAADRCFLPMDADQPQQRINKLLAQSGASHFIDARDQPAIIASQSTHTPQCSLTKDACYVLYTSGTTGSPNGVVVGHDSVWNLLEEFERLAPLQNNRCSWWTNPAFDVSIYELFSALLFGRTLYVPDQEVRDQPEQLVQWIKANAISSAYLPPFALKEFLEHSQAQANDSLQRLLVGVEPIPQQLLSQIMQSCPELQIINGYGPTEATVCATLLKVNSSDTSHSMASIGKAVRGNGLRIVDSAQEPTPHGVVGELLIRGAGLARGYMNRPQLSAERFIQLSDHPAVTWYRTGDQVRIAEDGNLQFKGRIDKQLKIRGHRIEPAEIEAAMLTHPDVERCVACEDQRDNRPVIVAHYVSKHSLTSATLMSHLQSHLPDSMLPTAYLWSAKFPTTPNGKIDCKALPKLKSIVLRDVAPAETATQQTLVEVWREVMQLEQVGIRDSFFELGGDSITAIQIASRAGRRGFHMTPAQIFKDHTIERLAPNTKQKASINCIADTRRTGRFPLTPIQQWFFTLPLDSHSDWHQSLTLRLCSSADVSLLQNCLRTLIHHHELLRATFVQQNGVWVGEIPLKPSQELTLATTDLTTVPPQQVTQQQAVIEARLHEEIDISTGQLVSAAAVKMADGQVDLTIVIHHLAVDAISWNTVRDDLTTLYLAGNDRSSIKPTEPFIQWAEQLTHLADSKTIQSDYHDYWKHLWKRIPVVKTDRTATLTIAPQQPLLVSANLSKQDTLKLRDFATSADATIHEILTSAFGLALIRKAQSAYTTFDIEMHGRNSDDVDAPDMTETVGWFTAVAPVVLNIPDTDSASQVLTSVCRTLRSRPTHGQSFGLLKHCSRNMAVRDALSKEHQSDVLFNYFGSTSNQQAPNSLIVDQSSLKLWRSSITVQPYSLEANVSLVDDELYSEWSFNPAQHCMDAIKDLANSFLSNIRWIIEAQSVPDFPDIDERTLAKVSALLSKAESGRRGDL